ncbi:ion channel protein [Celeribacter ethanolicus]|uniref:Ion channel protein n=1 Tax=Celeribacter ethanolicus TaxID=1758178 RepID=A0A291GFL0_9RHOB|nr:ion channel [Celeribacter ethanolicus]ATG48796.1 ion channel protein [Celeribacter ethanolicus]
MAITFSDTIQLGLYILKFLFPKRTSTFGSNGRKVWSLLSLVIVLALIAEAAIPRLDISGQRFVAFVALIWSFAYFLLVIAAIPFLTSQNFWPNPARLAVDTLISISLSIMSFSLIYRIYEIIGPDQNIAPSVRDYIYFSTVTFSTLGFGDFRPATDARMFAALQSILGNLHLGMIVGTAFFAAQPK